MYRSLSILLLAIFALTRPTVSANSREILEPLAPLTDQIRQTPMPELPPSRVGKILQRYYQEGLGGPKAWADFESVKMQGTLELEDVDLKFSAFRKKPNLLKISLQRPETEIPTVMAYDGKRAWMKIGRSAARPMEIAETRRFAQDAHFGSHLLYPFTEGKTIEYIDTVTVAGEICHHIRVTIPDGYQIDYFIDITTFLEAKAHGIDMSSGFESTRIYKDYNTEHGIPIARIIENYQEDERISRLIVLDIKINTGLMPWMFKPNDP